jgi:hypothetical protein
MVANLNIIAKIEEKKSYCISISASRYSSTWQYCFYDLANNLHLNYPNTMAMRGKAAVQFLVVIIRSSIRISEPDGDGA